MFKRKNKYLLISFVGTTSLFLLFFLFASPGVQAGGSGTFCQDGTEVPQEVMDTRQASPENYCRDKGGVASDGEASGFDEELSTDCTESDNNNKDALHPDNCGITKIIRTVTDALSVLVGIVVVMSLVIAGVQYSSAGSNPQAVAAAKARISQALIALVIYLFLFTFLQWLVPGGVL